MKYFAGINFQEFDKKLRKFLPLKKMNHLACRMHSANLCQLKDVELRKDWHLLIYLLL